MRIRIGLLGDFTVAVDDVPVPPEAWSRRHAAGLVKLLTLTPGRRLHREQVLEALWPGVPVEAAGPRLHKAAHYARRALGNAGDALVLRHDVVSLLTGDEVQVDFDEFVRLAQEARQSGSPEAAATALAAYGGALLPQDPYESWLETARDQVRHLHHDLLRLAGRWEDLLHEDPTDEQAHLALVRASAERGDVHTALRQLERLDRALRRELGTTPSAEAERLRTQLEGRARIHVPVPRGTRLVGRRDLADRIRAALDSAEGSGRGSTLLLTGPPGVGKTAVLALARGEADRRGWRTGRGTASAVEGPWPYASILEALGDLCRRHPALLDGLADSYRLEIERALAGRDVSWDGESGHQRLFVATAELLRLASAGHGLLLVVDDLHEADEASLRLLHYLARCAVSEPVVLAVARRSTGRGEALRDMEASLVTRGIGERIEVGPLDEAATRRLVRHAWPDADDQAADRVWTISGGLPYTALELARDGGRGSGGVGAALHGAARATFERVAALGMSFSTDELVAVAGTDDEAAYAQLEAALEARVVEPADSGYRFRHALVREALLDAVEPHRRAVQRLEVAERLAATGAPPARVAHQLIAAGEPGRAIEFVIPAVETAGALGAYRDALALVEPVLGHADGERLAHLLARRGDLLMALGDPGAVAAYSHAAGVTTGTEHRLVRARLCRVACFAGDFDTAAAALDGLEPAGDAADGPILLARGNLAYFTGDIDTAWEAASKVRAMLLRPGDPWQYVDLISLQGLIAHQRGEWFQRFLAEMRSGRQDASLATALYDAHLCVAEYLLYGPIPYPDVIALADDLRRRAEHFGALRGVAFSRSLIGEAALLMGDLARAERELSEAVDLHREIDAAGGQSHSLQRLAEVRLLQGDPDGARTLLLQALPLARWSIMPLHLLQRIHGSLIAAAPDPFAALAEVERAEAALGETDQCPFCAVMFEVPATIACADAGDLGQARRHLAAAEESAARWEGSAWQAAVLEARAHLAAAEGEAATSRELMERAAARFQAAGQPLDAARCRAAATNGLAVALAAQPAK